VRNLLIVVLAVSVAAALTTALQGRGATPPQGKTAYFTKGDPLGTQARPGNRASAPLVAEYNGLRVRESRASDGDDSGLQRQLGSLLENIDFVPAERADRFQWVTNCGGLVTGWDGVIEDVLPAPTGFLVRLRVYPTHTVGGLAAINGQATEYYLFSQDRIDYIGTEDAIPAILTFN